MLMFPLSRKSRIVGFIPFASSTAIIVQDTGWQGLKQTNSNSLRTLN